MTAPSPLAGAKVAEVLDLSRVVINRGSAHGVKHGQRFVIYHVGKELTDPDTGESLGHLEIVRGTGKVEYVQEKMATLRSDRVTLRKVRARNSLLFYGADTDETITEPLPFDEPARGDLARPI